MKSIFQYSTSQEFIKAVVTDAQVTGTGLSIENYADRVGIGRSTLKMILSGKRRLTVGHIHHLAGSLRLSMDETEYLQTLVLKERAKVPKERIFYEKRTTSLKKKSRLTSHSVLAKGLLSDPYILPILVYLTDFHKTKDLSSKISPADVKMIAKRFKIDPSRVQSAIELLTKSQVIQRRTEDSEVHYVYGDIGQTINQKQYLKNWLSESAKRVDSEFNNKTSYFTASAFTIDKEMLPQMISDLKAVFEKYLEMSAPDDGKLMVQGCIQLFPILS
jgi:uncharacterized protein (TIGR02147 family)